MKKITQLKFKELEKELNLQLVKEKRDKVGDINEYVEPISGEVLFKEVITHWSPEYYSLLIIKQ